VPGATQV